MAHTPPCRSGLPCNKSYYRFGSILFYPVCSIGFHASTNLANHYNAICIFIIHKKLNSFFCCSSNSLLVDLFIFQ